MSRLSFGFAAVLVAVGSATATAQMPSPLELARGLREKGMPDLALELFRDLESKPLPPDQKALLPLERAKTQLEAADEEPDEGARSGMIAEAKEGFTSFLRTNTNHPRAPEASLALARLSSLEAKAQLARAKRLDPTTEEDKAKQKAEAAKARPLFKAAAVRFGEASKRIEAKLQDSNLDAPTRRAIEREIFETDLASGINQCSMADTYIDPNTKEKGERDGHLKQAYDLFAKLAEKGQADRSTQNVDRTIWVAKAWMGECEFERDRNADGEKLFKDILAAGANAAEDGKRMVRFFQLRRSFIKSIGDPATMPASATLARNWLSQYDSVRRPSPEAIATKFYLAVNLQMQAELSTPRPKDAKGLPPLVGTARFNMESAEKLYRVISQTDNDYTARATKRRMQVVYRLLGDTERPPHEYRTFEESQMAALIQMSKLGDTERDAAKGDELKARRLKVIALLERARELITPKELKENAAEVADVMVRLIYFYQLTDQPFQAAVLGEHVARTMKIPVGKLAQAGAMGVNGYASATASLTAGPGLDEARKSDRERAIRLGKFLDEKFAADSATDRARHRLAGLLLEEGKPVEAYDILQKIRAGYSGITDSRLLQAGIAFQLLAAGGSPLPDDRKKTVFHKAIAELEKTVKPEATASIEDVEGYIKTRCRIASLYLLQSRVDAEAEKKTPGVVTARKIAEDVIGQLPNYFELIDGDKLNISGQEMQLLAEDARTRAVFLGGRNLLTQGKTDEAFGAIGDVITQMKKSGPFYTDEMKKWQAADQDKNASLKSRVANLASGVDQVRRDVIVLAVKARVKQGQVDQATELIDLLKSFGGNVEANIPVLQQLATELSAQIHAARAAGKLDEAKTLTEGFTKLLDKLSDPKLPPSVQLFIGQSLNSVGESARAVEVLKKIPNPGDALLTKPTADLSPEERQAAGLFRVGTLHLVRAHRGAKQFKEADEILKKVIGTPEKPGWANARLEYRKEVAYLFEAQGAEEPDVPKANRLWGQALQQWNSLFGIARKRLADAQNKMEKEKNDPKIPDAQKVTGAQIVSLKNGFFEAFFDTQRCVVKANMQLLKTNPTKLQSSLTTVAGKFVEIEKQSGTDINADVRNKYAELLAEVPDLKKAYQAAGGKLFLER